MTPRDAIKQQLTIFSLEPAMKPGLNSSPFRQDSTPSFSVTPDGTGFHDFGTEEHGDVISFRSMQMGRGYRPRGADYIAVLQDLADRAGVPLKEYSDEELAELEKVRAEEELLADIHLAAAKWFNEQLGDKREYYVQRGFTDETIDELLLGYAPVGDGLRDHLMQTWKTTDLLKSGLFVPWQNSIKAFFQGRYVFPYWRQGRVVYFIARATAETPAFKDREAPKYVKLLTHNTQKRQYVSQQVQNPLWGSARHDEPLLITEGVADAISLYQTGYAVVSPVTVRFSARDHPAILEQALKASEVYILNDNEENKAGEEGALDTARYLAENGASNVFIVTLPRPDGTDKVDVNNLLADLDEDEAVETVRHLLESAESLFEHEVEVLAQAPAADKPGAYESVIALLRKTDPVLAAQYVKPVAKAANLLVSDVRESLKEESETSNEEEREEASQSTRVVEMIRRRVERLFVDEHGATFAAIRIQGVVHVYPIGSTEVKHWVNRQWFIENETAVSPNSVSAALAAIQGEAYFEGERRKLHLRSAWDDDGNILLDLANDKWEALRITPNGSEVIENPLVFRRYSHMLPISPSEEAASLDEIWRFVNVSKKDRLGVKAYLALAWIPDVPLINLMFHGPHGSAKSTAHRFLRLLLDPSSLELLALPTDERELVQVLNKHRLPYFDNVGILTDRQSDILCRATTGEGHRQRKLYTDDDDVVYTYMRGVGLNGINIPASKPDLLDRSYLAELDRVPREDRKPLDDLKAEWLALVPRLQRRIIEVLSKALTIYPKVREELTELPRMASFAMWGEAVSRAMGEERQAFLTVYNNNIAEQNAEALEQNPLALAVLQFMSKPSLNGVWEGTPSALYKELDFYREHLNVGERDPDWPSSPVWLTRKLNAIKPNLEESLVRFIKERDGSMRKLRLERLDEDELRDLDSPLTCEHNIRPDDCLFCERERGEGGT